MERCSGGGAYRPKRGHILEMISLLRNRVRLQKLTLSFTSKREFRALVVWGTNVAKARSCSSAPMLITKHGRTLAAIPRSTIHTSPRRGSFMDRFFPI